LPDGWNCCGVTPSPGANVFDLQIVATMQANGINRIYTFNSDDFTMFPELVVLTP
jgi:predicted nucleic acid-binding protein